MRTSEKYRKAYQNIPAHLKEHFLEWLHEMKRTPSGEDIIRNIFSDQHLKLEIFASFLTHISTFFEADSFIPSNSAAQSAYIRACERLLSEHGQRLACLGPISKLSAGVLVCRVLLLKKLRVMIARAMKKTGSERNEAQEAWELFSELADEGKFDDCIKILRKASPCPADRTSWVYFDANQFDIDPLFKESIEHCLDQLGLPPEWYPRGKDRCDPEGSWRIRYRFSETSSHIPTIADTVPGKWNPYFQTSQDVNWGWTRPLGKPRGERGLPEVVHRGWENGKEIGAISELPEFLE